LKTSISLYISISVYIYILRITRFASLLRRALRKPCGAGAAGGPTWARAALPGDVQVDRRERHEARQLRARDEHERDVERRARAQRRAARRRPGARGGLHQHRQHRQLAPSTPSHSRRAAGFREVCVCVCVSLKLNTWCRCQSWHSNINSSIIISISIISIIIIVISSSSSIISIIIISSSSSSIIIIISIIISSSSSSSSSNSSSSSSNISIYLNNLEGKKRYKLNIFVIWSHSNLL